jgi:hypothetical protein
MSALITTLVESETKESLAEMYLEARKQYSEARRDLAKAERDLQEQERLSLGLLDDTRISALKDVRRLVARFGWIIRRRRALHFIDQMVEISEASPLSKLAEIRQPRA